MLTRLLALLMLCGLVASGAQALGRGSGGASGLQRLPWEGGPAYWAQFPATAAAGWTDPAFFPFVLFLNNGQAPITTAAWVQNYLNVGVNILTDIPPGSDMAVMRSKGMWVIQTRLGTGSLPAAMGAETVGYLIDDEAEMAYGPGNATWTGAVAPRDKTQCGGGLSCEFTVLSTQKTNLPVGGPFTLNFSPYMAAPSFLPLTAQQQRDLANNYANMYVSLDYYWYADAFTCAASQGGAEALGLPFTTALTSTQCHRASNYGKINRDLRSKLNPMQPFWGFVELACGNCVAGSVAITGPQLQGAAWNMIINEARGIQFFGVTFGGSCIGDVVQLNCNGINSAITTLTVQVKALATVINTQTYNWNFNPNINSMMKRGPDGKWYIFAMQAGFNDSNTYTFTLPPNFTTASTAAVMNESRTVAISGGTFFDAFANEYDHHIYQVTP